jgi:drug/metabolite transporter (DMT)-like permease
MAAWQMFLVAVLVWSTTWHAILYQLAYTTPELGVTLRFGLAGLGLLVFCAWRGVRWRMGLAEHVRLAAQGVFMYSVSYIFVYHAEMHVASGLVAVGFSASPLLNGLASKLLWHTAMPRRFMLGGALGLVGVALIFWPELQGVVGSARAVTSATASESARASGTIGAITGNAALGLMFTLGAVGLSCIGSLVASRNSAAGLPLWSALGWGMLYSALCSAGVVLAMGQPLVLPTALSFWLALAYLALFGSGIAFACFLVLQDRWGPGRASMVGVAVPVVALGISAVLEGYRPGALAMVGVALAVGGNWLALRPARERAKVESNEV